MMNQAVSGVTGADDKSTMTNIQHKQPPTNLEEKVVSLNKEAIDNSATDNAQASTRPAAPGVPLYVRINKFLSLMGLTWFVPLVSLAGGENPKAPTTRSNVLVFSA